MRLLRCFFTLYLLLRGNSAHNEFCDRLLSSMRFHQFILERGPPFRVCDLFDEEYNLYADGYSLSGDSTLVMNDKEHDYDMLMNHQSVLTGGGGGLSPVTSSLHLIERLSTKLLDNVSCCHYLFCLFLFFYLFAFGDLLFLFSYFFINCTIVTLSCNLRNAIHSRQM
ncbi:unnamed protein product [Trichobilharzia regenti]|nr:unnamed protein product [Trichobilharzia regenti]